MKTIVILAHPNIQDSIINKYWVNHLPKDTSNITLHSLYEKYPDGDIDVASEQALLETHDRIIFQFPVYWYSAPSLLKEWFDRVFTFGWAYGPEGGRLSGKEMGLVVSTGGPQEAYTTEGHNRFTLSEILRSYQSIANYVNARYLPIYAYYDSFSATDQSLKSSLQNYLDALTK